MKTVLMGVLYQELLLIKMDKKCPNLNHLRKEMERVLNVYQLLNFYINEMNLKQIRYWTLCAKQILNY